MATNTAPANWWDEPDEVLATALDVLTAQAERAKAYKTKRKGR